MSLPVTRTRNDVVTEARKWLDVPWRHQGRSKRGIDCAGLIATVGRDLGLSTYDSVRYHRRPTDGTFVHHFKDNLFHKPLSSAIPGDILLFRDNKFTCHSAFVTERFNQLYILHALSRRRKVVEELYDQEWRQEAMMAFCFHGMENEPWLG